MTSNNRHETLCALIKQNLDREEGREEGFRELLNWINESYPDTTRCPEGGQ